MGLRQVGNLGDCLYLTPAINALNESGKEVVIQMHDNAKCREVSAIFKNLARVDFVDNPTERVFMLSDERTHCAQKTLNYFNINSANCIPKIKLTEDEIAFAQKYLAKFNNPIILNNDNLGSNDPLNHCAIYRRPPEKLMQYIADYFRLMGYTVLQFGPKQDIWESGFRTFSPLNRVVHIRDLDLRQTAACFAVIKKIITGDTGLYHLMLSVGGKAVTFHPPENKRMGYEFWGLHYTPDLWKDEKPRVKYLDYTTFNGSINEIVEFLK